MWRGLGTKPKKGHSESSGACKLFKIFQTSFSEARLAPYGHVQLSESDIMKWDTAQSPGSKTRTPPANFRLATG